MNLLLLFLLANANNRGVSLQHHLYENTISVIPEKGINLTMSLAIRAFNNIDQIDGSISMNIWLRYSYKNEYLMESKDYGNITDIHLNTNPDFDNFIWTPDIYLYNTAEKPMDESRLYKSKCL